MNFSRLMSVAGGHAEARILQSAVALGVFDVLSSGARTAGEVAALLELDDQATELLLNALTALALLSKEEEKFSLSETAKLHLVKSSSRYVGGMIRFEDMTWDHWTKLPEALRTGRPVRGPDMYQEDARETEIFIHAMDSLVRARGDTEAVAQAIDWASIHSLLDVGSGPATYPIALCRRFPHLRATILDLPGTLEITARYVREANLADRIDLVAGDYRKDSVPGEFDAVFLSNIIHGENYQRNQTLIAMLAQKVDPAGLLIIKDHVLDGGRANPPVGAIFSLLMLLTTDGGRCYSYGEVKTWLMDAGLTRIRQIDLPAPLTSSLVIGSR
jgi:hypothetical protein